MENILPPLMGPPARRKSEALMGVSAPGKWAGQLLIGSDRGGVATGSSAFLRAQQPRGADVVIGGRLLTYHNPGQPVGAAWPSIYLLGWNERRPRERIIEPVC